MSNTNIITIAELDEIQSAPDASFIPIDDGSTTNKITVENFNASSTATATAQALKSEGYADGKQDGVDVEEGSPYYHNNAKYYSDQASATKTTVEGYVELAQTAQETATQKASDASSAEEFAEAFAGDARRYAQAADGHAVDASNYATVASSAATTATNAKNSAINAASDAQSAKLDAISAKNTAVSAKDDAETAATSSHVEALKSEGYALGKQNGAAVTSGSPYYNNNAFYFYRQALSKANLAEYLSQVSEGYAKGTMDGSPCQHDEPGYNDNSKYYKDQAASSASSAASSASSAAAWSSNPPKIGDNGNWYVWDTSTHAYKDSGVDASITITVGTTTTLAPGSSATCTNSGSSTDAIFNFGIPQGAQGDIGNDGYSPVVTITEITGGHTVTITDKTHQDPGQSFNVMDGDASDKMDKVNPTGTGSLAVGDFVEATGTNSQATGNSVTASSNYSHAEGIYTEAKTNDGAHAEGCGSINPISEVEYKVTASGKGAHAEGYATILSEVTASGNGSHAEGTGTTSSGNYSHAEGSHNTASGVASHAGGEYNTAAYEAQTVIGKYNNNKSDTLFEVGNGTASNAKSNAFEVYANGDVNIKGSIKKNGSNLAYSDLANTPTLGAAAAKDSTNAVTQNSTALVESGAVYSYIDTMITQALTASY